MNLKDITKDLHIEAEKTKISQDMIKGNISKEKYAEYLWQMYLVYSVIESLANTQNIFAKLSGIQRTEKILEDFKELSLDLHHFKWLPETLEYVNYLIEKLPQGENAKNFIMAHAYVRHMGDLFGGQIISTKVPGSGKFYKFENADDLKWQIRTMLNEDMGLEARTAFQYNIRILNAIDH